MENIASRVPVDSTAARVVSKGVEYDWRDHKKVQTVESETPFSLVMVPEFMDDLTGMTVGRFKVMGLHTVSPARWSLRCSCGRFSLRRAKSIKNPKNDIDRCERCRHLAAKQKSHIYHSTGRYEPWNR